MVFQTITKSLYGSSHRFLQASAYGLPTVATKNGGPVDILKVNIWLSLHHPSLNCTYIMSSSKIFTETYKGINRHLTMAFLWTHMTNKA